MNLLQNGKLKRMNEKDTLEAWDIASIKVAIIGSGIMGNGIKEFLDSRGVKAYLISARSLLEAFDSSKDAIPLCDLIIECCALYIALDPAYQFHGRGFCIRLALQ
jgi:hypothetical protein